MEKIKVITDSTSDLGREASARYGIEIVPLTVHMDGRSYLDGVDITPDQFYPMLAEAPSLPKTSQPSPADFIRVYEDWAEQGYHVVSLHLSRGLSSTVDTARMAAEHLGVDRVSVVDSGFLSWGLAFQVVEAAVAAAEGLSVRDVIDRARYVRDRLELLFSLDTLHYLEKGGRIGKVSALLGSLLHIKPLIRVENGVYVPFGKVRSQAQALERFVQFMKDAVGTRPVRVAVGHGHGLAAAKKLKEMIQRSMAVSGDIVLFEVGPVIGVHTGPGTVGVAFYPV